MKTIYLGNDRTVKIKKIKSNSTYNKSVQFFIGTVLCFGTNFKETTSEHEILDWVALTEKTI